MYMARQEWSGGYYWAKLGVCDDTVGPGPEAHITTTEGSAKHLPLWEIYALAAEISHEQHDKPFSYDKKYTFSNLFRNFS